MCEILLQLCVFCFLYVIDWSPPQAGGSVYSFVRKKALLFTLLCYQDVIAVTCYFVFAHSSEFWPSMKLTEQELKRRQHIKPDI